MATLISSKQIQGVVTASVIQGDFSVGGGGSVNLSAASGVTGSFTGSFIGDGSGIVNIPYTSIVSLPTLVSGSSQIDITQTDGFTSFSSSIATSLGSVDTDDQTVSFNSVSKVLTISEGNSVDLSSLGGGGGGGGSSIWSTGSSWYFVSADFKVTGSFDATSLTGSIDYSNLTNVPTLISGSSQITSSLDSRYALSGSGGGGGDVTHLNTFTSSIQTEVDGLSAATSSYITSIPSGTVSGSIQVLGGTDIVSSSKQITDLGFISSSDSTTSINTFTSSIQTEVDALSAATSSYLTSETDSQTLSVSGDQLTITGGNTVTIPTGSELPAGTISGSKQVTDLGFISSSDSTTSLNSYTSSNETRLSGIDTRITGIDTITSSLDDRLDNVESTTSSLEQRVGQIESNTGSYDDQTVISSLNTFTGSYYNDSASFQTQITTEKGRVDAILTSADADKDSFAEIVTLINQVDTSNDNAFAAHYTSSRQRDTALESFTSSIQTEVNLISAETSSYLTQVPAGTVSGSIQVLGGTGILSGSEQLPSGVVSGSIQLLGGTDIVSSSAQITDLGFISSSDSTTSLNTFTSSIQTEVDGLSSVTSSYITSLPSGILSGSKTDISSINTFTSSIQTQVNAISAATSSYLTEVPSGTVSGSSQLTSSLNLVYQLSGSGGDASFDGNRIVSSEKLPTMFTSSFNPGTSGSISDFLNAVFYPNSEPSITSGNQTISEYSSSGSPIFTLEATDPEGQALTFGTGSTYTDDLVRVASNGVVTLNALPTSASFNTDLVGGSHGHTFIAKSTDTFNASIEKNITIFVTPNSTPVFRETSVSGNIITSVSSNLNESSADDTLVKRVFFTDANGDNITIHSSSIDGNHFEVIKSSTYVDILQNTGSLNYEEQTTYNFSISASDEHYEAGQDSDSIVGLPITVNVTDNLKPTLSNQSLSAINENSSNGATVGTISAADNEGDTITFTNFTLYKLELDNASGSYGGTSQLTDPHENPFQMSSSGVVTRKTGVFLNSDLINEYQYTVEIKDAYNELSNPAIITIPITDDTPATLSDNFTNLFIKESEESGTTIKTTNYGSTTADFDSNQSGAFTSSNPAIAINGSGNLSLNVDLSGSVTQSGETLGSTITFTNTFSTTTTQNINVSVIPNHHPSASFTLQNSNLNTNLATTNTNLVSVSITDTESDTPYSASLSGTDAGKLNINYTNSNSSSLFIRANENLSSGTITYNLRVTDSYSEVSDYTGQTIPINQADTGTLGGDTTSHLIESARSGSVLRDASGFEAGNASQLTVSYSGSDGSPSVQSFTSSNASIDIDNSGNLTLASDISGSDTSSGDSISSTITFQDNYGNLGSGSLTVNVFANSHPSASFTNNSGVYNTNQATSSALMVSLTITDEETDTPFSMSLSGTDAGKFNIEPQNSVTSSVQLTAASDFDSGTYSYTASIFDQFGETSQYEREITIAEADLGTLGTNGTFYVIESAVNGNNIVTNSNGRTGTQGDLGVSYSPNYGSQVVQEFTSSNAFVSVNASGNLSVGTNISGSSETSGDSINSNITWADQHGNVGSGSISVNVTTNNAPTTSSISTQFENTNQATGSVEVLELTISDTESDSMPNSGLTWSSYNSTYFTPSVSTPNMSLNVNNTSVPSGTYPWEVTLKDEHGFNTRVVSGSLVITQADTGTMSGDSSVFAIESALSGSVLRDATGFGNGNAGDVDVSYSPSFGSPIVQSFTSSNAAIAINDTGGLTLAVDLSGSVTQSGDTVNTTITFDDQYGNVGSGSVTLTVFGNQSPVASFTSSSNYETNNATSGSDAGALVVTDVESNSPFTVTLAGTDGAKFDVSGSTSPFEIQPTGSLDSGTYSINITVTDSYSESVTLSNQSIVVEQSANIGKIYIYYSNYGTNSGFSSNYNSVMGASTVNSDTPPQVTAYTGNTSSPYYKFKTGDVGASSISLAGGKTATLAATVSGSDLNTAISESAGAMSWAAGVQTIVVFPSGSTMLGVPTSMTDGFGGSTAGQYVLVEYADGTSAPLGASPTVLHSIVLDSSKDGFDEFFVLGTVGQNSATTMRLKVLAVSGSLGAF